MRARTRWVLTVASVLWIADLVVLWPHLSARLEWLVATAVVPLVWLIWSFCRWSAHQHANRWARDIDRVHRGRPVPLPERVG